jgi:signal transduction histidine kinase
MDATSSRSFGVIEGPGPVRALMRACDWSTTPLGSPETWPASLSAVVRVILTSRFAMWMAWGPELTFLCNDAYLPTVGIKRDWVMGSRSDRVWAEIWPDIGPRIDQVLKTGQATWDEALLLYLERSGFPEETYHTFSYSPLANDGGAISGMLCVVAEVTERVIGERQLSTLRDLGSRLAAGATRSDARAALLQCLEKHPQDMPFAALYFLNSSGEPELAAVHGLKLAATSPWPFSDLSEAAIVPVDAKLIGDLQLAHWQRPPSQALISPLLTTEGNAPIGFLVTGLNPHRSFDDEYRGFIALVASQMTAAIARADQYERERQRAEALAELDRAKTAFFSNVSHEFRTPLTLMLGPLEDALAAEPDEGPQKQRLDTALRNALRLLRLVNSLLDFSRIEAGRVDVRFQPTDLAALTAELASSFRAAIERAGMTLQVDAKPLPQAAYVDRDMWEKIVLNLLSNAFKFTLQGGISVKLGQVNSQGHSSVVLTLSDTGVGIPAAELPKLFDRFHRVDGVKGRSFEGSGIGLALVQELVKIHSGKIEVESEVGKGTTFTVTMPLGTSHFPADRIDAAGDEVISPVRAQTFVEEALRWLPGGDEGADIVDEVPAAAPLVAAGHKGRVVVADDNSDLRGYISRLLVERGYTVELAPDGNAALEILRQNRPDLLITDVMMPGLDGFGLLREVRADLKLADLPVIMLSARAGEEAKVEGLDAGADDYLTKPFSARELLARVAANISMARLRAQAAAAITASEAREREQAERVQLALDAGAIVGTWVWDVETDQFTADERFARTFDLDPEACRNGIPLSDAVASIHPDDVQRVEQTIAEALARGGSYRCEYRVRQREGNYRWIEANGRVDSDANGAARRFPGVLIDIEHRRQIESALRELNEQLESKVAAAIAERETMEEALRQSQKMEAVGQLTGGIAHDFNNLLTIITGNVEMAKRALSTGETVRVTRAMDNAFKGAERAASLTQRLLAFSRRQPLAPKPINVDRLVAGMADLLHRSLGETIELETVASPGLWQVEADPNQLESALLNLAVNAKDAMPEGGKLTVETANTRLDKAYSAAHAEVAPGNYVVIAVTDTGHGMSRDTLARVFDPFFTTKEVGKGTGLGLSMVYGFVKQSGGHVKIYSEPNSGTTVKIYLPRLLNGAEEEEEKIERSVDRGGEDHTILVVEDDHDVRAYTVEILRELGYRVIEAHDGASALKLIEMLDQRLDLLFTDVVMPIMSGRQLADEARRIRPSLKVLFTSGYTKNSIVHNGRLDPGVEIIGKPFTYQALAEKIADVLDIGRTGRVLLVESDPAMRMSAVEALQTLGLLADQAGAAAEAIGKMRAAQGRYDAVLIDEALPDKRGEALARELRAMHADLPLLIASAGQDRGLSARFPEERRTAIIDKPYDAAGLRAAFERLGVRCRAPR